MRNGNAGPDVSAFFSPLSRMSSESMRTKLTETVSPRSASRLSWKLTLRASIASQATRSALISRASAPRTPSAASSRGAKPSAQCRPLSVSSSQKAAATNATAKPTSRRRIHFMSVLEHEADRKVQSRGLHLLAVRDIDAHRPNGRAETAADADANCGIVAVGTVPRVASVDESREPPRLAHPVRYLRAADEHIAPADDRRASL